MSLVAIIQLILLCGAFGASRIPQPLLRKVLGGICGFYCAESIVVSLFMSTITGCVVFLVMAILFGAACYTYWPRRQRVTA